MILLLKVFVVGVAINVLVLANGGGAPGADGLIVRTPEAVVILLAVSGGRGCGLVVSLGVLGGSGLLRVVLLGVVVQWGRNWKEKGEKREN